VKRNSQNLPTFGKKKRKKEKLKMADFYNRFLADSQNITEFLSFKKNSCLVYSQIWLNLCVDDCMFGYLTKSQISTSKLRFFQLVKSHKLENLKSSHFKMFINNFCNIIRLFVAMWATCSKAKLPHGQCSQFSKNKIIIIIIIIIRKPHILIFQFITQKIGY
jgi:hypothetical protein